MAPRTREKAAVRMIVDDIRPGPVDHQGDHPFAELARQHWLKTTKRTAKVKVKTDVINELWEVLERDDFSFGSLLILENLQTLEKYLWPGFTEDSSNNHILLIALLTNVRTREHLPAWILFSDDPLRFSLLFKRIRSTTLDNSYSTSVRTHLLSFMINAFQSLDSGVVRKECAPLVSISIWHNLSSDEKRETLLNRSVQLRKAWRASAKRNEAADDETKSKLRFERSWLFMMILDFFRQLYDDKANDDNLHYCERFLELLSDLQSQLPTRRYVNTLFQDLHCLSVIKCSPMFNNNDHSLLHDLFALLSHFSHFAVDDYTGNQYSTTAVYEQHCQRLSNLQRTAIKTFKEKLTMLALANYGSIERRSELEQHLKVLADDEMIELCARLQLRTTFPPVANIVLDRSFFMEVLLSSFEKQKTFQESARDLSIMPTERTLFDPALLRNETYNGAQSLALPKLNLQYLTVGDFLWRSLVLHRCESFFAIRKDIEDAINRLRPKRGRQGDTYFEGFSKMAMPVSRPSILEVLPPLVGDERPSIVRAELTLDVSKLADNVRRDWESLRPDDVVFLLSVEATGDSKMIMNGGSVNSELQQLGLKHVRGAEVVQVLDDKGRSLRDTDHQANGYGRPKLRKLQIKLDSVAYTEDIRKPSSGRADVYESMNVVIRRQGRENNFKPILESIQSLALSDLPLASWLQEVFLGYGDPAGASYANMTTRPKSLDFRDTFIDWQHLVESLPGKVIVPDTESDSSFGPPYILDFTYEAKATDVVQPKATKKRRRDQPQPPAQDPPQAVSVSTYKPPNNGPYAMDAPRLNHVRFTPTQVEAIISGSQPGLTVIVGPPGTGKTDVATQIINNIYHDFPEQRTLLIAHSNQALNQLFQKIVALDIDERHLLRLGHGEEELDTQTNFSKHGRVDSFLENRDRFLLEVDRLAANLRAPGAHGSSAETAGYFNSVYVQPAWARFQEISRNEDMTPETLVAAFPFQEYFSNAPQPLFPETADLQRTLDIANGCHNHISKIFAELADVRPFEILRRDRDKANYLLVNEARIIAMTSTHAAMRRREIASLGFHYDNVIMEEAAQITEIENFIPLALQDPKDGITSLSRVVLCGDHFQNSPVIQNLAFRQYANLEQSLFARLVRLGVPTIQLDQQGRARPSIADLYRWRYPSLHDLPTVETSQEFRIANAGFKYDYQFIDVPDYKGRGESEPTPHFIQNLGEAEYAVAIFQYMRLLGYPASKISILTTYAGQRALIRDVLTHRCAKNPLFGVPKVVTTVDKYQGEQNDYVILSLTRTSRVGYLRDVRRLTVALSRARLGLYILGRREVFETCFELHQAFDILFKRADKLMLVTGELWPSQRIVADEAEKGVVPGETIMEGVEHLGQYVYEMTNAKVKQLRLEKGLPEMDTPVAGVDAALADGEIAQHGGNMVEEDVEFETEE